MRNNQDKRIEGISGDVEQLDFDQTIDIFFEHLKKTQPSYTDRYELFGILRTADSPWAMCFEDDIGAQVKRISDGKKFLLGLSELESTDKKSQTYQLLNDYSVWFVNNR